MAKNFAQVVACHMPIAVGVGLSALPAFGLGFSAEARWIGSRAGSLTSQNWMGRS